MRHPAILLFVFVVACRFPIANDLTDDPVSFVRAACPVTVLPSIPTPDLLIGVSRTEIPRGGVPQKTRIEVGVGDACVPPDCVSVKPAEHAALYDAFVAVEFHRWATRHAQRSPHAGSQFLWLRWGELRCDIGYTTTLELEPAHADDFDALTERVWRQAVKGSQRAFP